MTRLPLRDRAAVALQRTLALVLSPVTTLAAGVLMRLWLRVRVVDAGESRRAYRRICGESDAPLLICGNHLTMVDSALIAYALGSPLWYVTHFSSLPWNVPEQTNFAHTPLRKILAYVYKCLPIVRGGSREALGATLARFSWLLERGEVGLIYPEGGRSRTGRVVVENAAYGVGRIVKTVPRCRVLCVYLRGEQQETYTVTPAKGDRLHVALATIEPKRDHEGLRGSRDVARQITAKLAEMERDHFEARS